MPSKPRTSSIRPRRFERHSAFSWVTILAAGVASFLVLLGLAPLLAQAQNAANSAPLYLSELSCSSSGCHGGGGVGRDQVVSWRKHDVHNTRPYATLTTPRAGRIAE